MLKWLLALLILAILATAAAARHGGAPGVSLSGLSLSNSSFTANTPNGTIGILSATTSDGSAITWTLKGANSGGFHILNGNTVAQQASTGTACGAYSDLLAQATSPTAVNSAQYIPLTLTSGPCISAITLSGTTFPTPSTNPLANISVTCSFGSCSGATFFVAVQAGCPSNDDAAFSISGSNVNAVTQINDTTPRVLCVEAILNGAPNFFQSFTLTGQSVVVSGCLPDSICPPGNFVLDFQDEFNGNSVDYTKWRFYADGTSLAGALVQNSLMTVNGGIVTMVVNQSGYFAVLDSINGYNGPGYWETRIRFNDSHSGYWHSAGWGNTLADGYEIDNPESFGGCGGVYHLIYAPGGNLTFIPPVVGFDPHTNLCDGFHIIGYEIDQATGGTFYMDGVPFGNVPDGYSTASFHTQIFVNYSAGAVAYVQVDWVRHYLKMP